MVKLLILILYQYAAAEKYSPLICTTAMDIKDCIMDNQGRISKMSKHNSEIGKITKIIEIELDETQKNLKRLSNTVETILEESALKIDLEGLKNDFSITLNLISEENAKTGKVLESQATQLDRLESNAQVYQSRDKEVKQSVQILEEVMSDKLDEQHSKLQIDIEKLEIKSAEMSEFATDESSKIESRLNQSDSTLRMIQGQLRLLEDAINEEKQRRNTDLQELITVTERNAVKIINSTRTNEIMHLQAKIEKTAAQMEGLKFRIDDIETKSKSEKYNFHDPYSSGDRLQNDQSGLDELKSRIDKVELDVVVTKNELDKEKNNSIKYINQVTGWLKGVFNGISSELQNQQDLMVNLTASIELKDKIIDDLTEKFQKSMESNEKLRSKLFSNDLDREFRLAKLELAMKSGSTNKYENLNLPELNKT